MTLPTNAVDDETDAKVPDKINKQLHKCDDEFDKARKGLDETKQDGAPGSDYDQALDHSRHAWEHAQHALDRVP